MQCFLNICLEVMTIVNSIMVLLPTVLVCELYRASLLDGVISVFCLASDCRVYVFSYLYAFVCLYEFVCFCSFVFVYVSVCKECVCVYVYVSVPASTTPVSAATLRPQVNCPLCSVLLALMTITVASCGRSRAGRP